MKRVGNLFEKITSFENLDVAAIKAQKNKKSVHIERFNCFKDTMLLQLQCDLQNGLYKTSTYDVFKVYEPKERDIYRLPYYPDRIVHHAIMNVLEDLFVKSFIKNTYACVKKRGIHKCLYDIKKDLKDIEGTKYCLKIDIKKFYPSIDNEILKKLLRKKIKCKKTLLLLDEIIDSEKGVPIGNYLSQYFANFYLTYFDHYCKEVLKVKYYYRYADDIVLLSNNKNTLREYFFKITTYLSEELNLTVKNNWQIFPVNERGIDFVGYVFRHTYILLRKSIKIKMKRAYRLNKYKSIPAYNGWAIHCNSKHLIKSLMKNTSFRGADNVPVVEDLGTGSFYFNFNIKKETVKTEEGKEEVKHSYNQIRCDYPEERSKDVIIDVIHQKLKEEEFELTKELKKYIDDFI